MSVHRIYTRVNHWKKTNEKKSVLCARKKKKKKKSYDSRVSTNIKHELRLTFFICSESQLRQTFKFLRSLVSDGKQCSFLVVPTSRRKYDENLDVDAVAFKPIVVSLDANGEDQFLMAIRQCSSDAPNSRAKFIHNSNDVPVSSIVFYCSEPVRYICLFVWFFFIKNFQLV